VQPDQGIDLLAQMSNLAQLYQIYGCKINILKKLFFHFNLVTFFIILKREFFFLSNSQVGRETKNLEII